MGNIFPMQGYFLFFFMLSLVYVEPTEPKPTSILTYIYPVYTIPLWDTQVKAYHTFKKFYMFSIQTNVKKYLSQVIITFKIIINPFVVSFLIIYQTTFKKDFGEAIYYILLIFKSCRWHPLSIKKKTIV